MHDDPRMNSRVHPNYKTRYRVTNWPSYDRALVQRGDITMWVSEDAIDAWKPRPSRRRGGQKRYSDTAIETTLTLRLFFNLPLRQTEGFLRSLFDLMGLSLEVPDHTTLSRRGQHLNVRLRRPANNKPMHLIVDSTGLSMVGEGEWAAAKHGKKGKRAWKKLHLGVDRSGVIVAQVLTDSNVDDANTGVDLIGQVDGTLMSVTGDAAYDTSAIYDAALERGAKVVVPPTRKAVVSGRRQRAAARDRTIRKVKKLGRREWKKVSGYHRQGTVENAFFRYKSIIGDRLRARHPKSQRVEVVVACNALPRSAGIEGDRVLKTGAVGEFWLHLDPRNNAARCRPIDLLSSPTPRADLRRITRSRPQSLRLRVVAPARKGDQYLRLALLGRVRVEHAGPRGA